MYVNKTEPIVRLVNVGLLAGRMGVDGQVCVIGNDDRGRSGSGSRGGVFLPLLDDLLVLDFIDDILHVAEHDEKDGEGRVVERTREALARE